MLSHSYLIVLPSLFLLTRGEHVSRPADILLISSANVAVVGPNSTIDDRMLRSIVHSLYSDLDLKKVDPKRTDATMIVMMFDADENLLRHGRIVRRTDRMLALDVLNGQFDGSLGIADLDHTGIIALTGPRDGVVPGSVWVCWGKLRR